MSEHICVFVFCFFNFLLCGGQQGRCDYKLLAFGPIRITSRSGAANIRRATIFAACWDSRGSQRRRSAGPVGDGKIEEDRGVQLGHVAPWWQDKQCQKTTNPSRLSLLTRERPPSPGWGGSQMSLCSHVHRTGDIRVSGPRRRRRLLL